MELALQMSESLCAYKDAACTMRDAGIVQALHKVMHGDGGAAENGSLIDAAVSTSMRCLCSMLDLVLAAGMLCSTAVRVFGSASIRLPLRPHPLRSAHRPPPHGHGRAA
jgi:hypothetical protein